MTKVPGVKSLSGRPSYHPWFSASDCVTDFIVRLPYLDLRLKVIGRPWLRGIFLLILPRIVDELTQVISPGRPYEDGP